MLDVGTKSNGLCEPAQSTDLAACKSWGWTWPASLSGRQDDNPNYVSLRGYQARTSVRPNGRLLISRRKPCRRTRPTYFWLLTGGLGRPISFVESERLLWLHVDQNRTVRLRPDSGHADGATWHFCSARCSAKFAADPTAFVPTKVAAPAAGVRSTI